VNTTRQKSSHYPLVSLFPLPLPSPSLTWHEATAGGRYSWPPQDYSQNSYYFLPDSPLSFASSYDSLTYDALNQHTTKSEPCPSPPLSTYSPILSSSTSVTSDDPASKRRRTDPIVSTSSHVASRVGRSLSPQSSRSDAPIKSAGISRPRYRNILPAPAKRDRSSEASPSQKPPIRHAASAPASPHYHGAPLSPFATQGGQFSHSPTDLPPRRYAGGQDSPFRPEKLEGNIPGSMLDTVSIIQHTNYID